MKKLLVICGPTATGKTALALKLAKKFNGELVSADSRQIYKGMDIGTGKDLPRNAKCQMLNAKCHFRNKVYNVSKYHVDGVGMWMLDVVNPDEEFSVAHYQYFATAVIDDIRKRGKQPIVAGGTGLYIKSLLSPIETSHIPPNKKLRKTLERYPLEDLQKKLQQEDFSLWNAMNLSDRQNPRRLIRKIEIIESNCHRESSFAGRGDLYHKDCFASLDEARNDRQIRSIEDVLFIGLTAPYPVLYERIDQRVEKRVQQGIVDEIKTLLHKGYRWGLASMNTFGYKEWNKLFQTTEDGGRKTDKNELIKQIIQKWKWDEHGYARRQMTWFKNMKGIRWFDITSRSWSEKVEAEVASWYT